MIHPKIVDKGIKIHFYSWILCLYLFVFGAICIKHLLSLLWNKIDDNFSFIFIVKYLEINEHNKSDLIMLNIGFQKIDKLLIALINCVNVFLLEIESESLVGRMFLIHYVEYSVYPVHMKFYIIILNSPDWNSLF